MLHDDATKCSRCGKVFTIGEEGFIENAAPIDVATTRPDDEVSIEGFVPKFIPWILLGAIALGLWAPLGKLYETILLATGMGVLLLIFLFAMLRQKYPLTLLVLLFLLSTLLSLALPYLPMGILPEEYYQPAVLYSPYLMLLIMFLLGQRLDKLYEGNLSGLGSVGMVGSVLMAVCLLLEQLYGWLLCKVAYDILLFIAYFTLAMSFVRKENDN